MIRGHLTSTDAIIAAHDDASEDAPPVRGVEKMPVSTRIKHEGKVYEVALAPRCFPVGSCAGCAWCAVLEGPLDSCEAGGRSDGLDVVMREIKP